MLKHVVAHPGGDEPLPTVFAFHGHGAHAQDLIGLAPHLAGGRTLWVAPQAPYDIEPGFYGFTWFQRGPDGQRSPEGVERTLDDVRGFLEEPYRRYSVDPSRVVLLGFSQGGMIAYRLALEEPRRFAGLAALSTTLSEEMVEALGPAEGREALPVLVQHGAEDPTIGVDRARESKTRLEALGITPEYREYAMGHAIGQESAVDLSRWLERVLALGPSSGLL
jgi:phospholipase/carboxylesterase